jgi:type I site-specific restriction endonuclease
MANLTTNNIVKILEVNNKTIFKKIDESFKENNKILVKRIDEVVNARLSEFSDAILETIDVNRNEANQKFDNLSKDVAGLKQDVKFIHQDIKDIVSDMSDKPSRKQFETFKSSFKNYATL